MLLDGDIDGLTDVDGLTDGDTDGLADAEDDEDGETLADGLLEADGETDADPVDDSLSAKKIAAVSPLTANVGFDVSPVLVLILNSPLTRTAAELLRDRAFVIAVKLVLGVICVVEFASFPKPRI
jgi:hypothetical protein